MPFVLPKPRIQPWRRLEREKVSTYPVFSIGRVRLEPPGSSVGRDFFTVECPDWCNVIPITRDDEIVLVWQYRFGTEAFSLEVPGGVIDPGETPERAAGRELLEETGYEADALEPFGVLDANPALQPNRCFTFVARGARYARKPAFDAYEECELALVPRRHLPELLDAGLVSHGLIAAALERFVRKGA